MAHDRLVQLHKWADGLRRELSLSDIIESVKQRMDLADVRDQYDLALILKGFLIEAGRDREALHIIDDMISRFPDDVRFPIAKASLNFYFLRDFGEALSSIDAALSRAHKTGFFRREALGVKARILLALGMREQLSETLEEIMGLEMKQGVPDIGRERDFIDRAPPDWLSEDLRARYDAFCPEDP